MTTATIDSGVDIDLEGWLNHEFEKPCESKAWTGEPYHDAPAEWAAVLRIVTCVCQAAGTRYYCNSCLSIFREKQAAGELLCTTCLGSLKITYMERVK